MTTQKRLGDDVAALDRNLERLDGPVVLVGHAYAGAVTRVAGREGPARVRTRPGSAANSLRAPARGRDLRVADRGQVPRVLDRGPVLPVSAVRGEVGVAAPDRDRERPSVDLVRVDRVRVGWVRADRPRERAASPRPPDTATLDIGLPPRPPAGRPVATREAAFTPETTVFTPPRIVRAPSDTPVPAALPPIPTPVPTADPTVRTAVSVGFFTIWGAFSCQTRAPYPATAPRNPATSHSSTRTASRLAPTSTTTLAVSLISPHAGALHIPPIARNPRGFEAVPRTAACTRPKGTTSQIKQTRSQCAAGPSA